MSVGSILARTDRARTVSRCQTSRSNCATPRELPKAIRPALAAGLVKEVFITHDDVLIEKKKT
jgi:hypothetical protein